MLKNSHTSGENGTARRETTMGEQGERTHWESKERDHTGRARRETTLEEQGERPHYHNHTIHSSWTTNLSCLSIKLHNHFVQHIETQEHYQIPEQTWQ
jgi:hypothetical protein